MTINEMHSLIIEDPDIKLKVPADFVLDRFGFRADAFVRDIVTLWCTAAIIFIASYLWLKYKVHHK